MVSGEPARAEKALLGIVPSFQCRATGLIARPRGAVAALADRSGGAEGVDGWLDHYRRIWDDSFNRLDECLHMLQAKARKHGRKQSDHG